MADVSFVACRWQRTRKELDSSGVYHDLILREYHKLERDQSQVVRTPDFGAFRLCLAPLFPTDRDDVGDLVERISLYSLLRCDGCSVGGDVTFWASRSCSGISND
jgi:hypothetical protein